MNPYGYWLHWFKVCCPPCGPEFKWPKPLHSNSHCGTGFHPSLCARVSVCVRVLRVWEWAVILVDLILTKQYVLLSTKAMGHVQFQHTGQDTHWARDYNRKGFWCVAILHSTSSPVLLQHLGELWNPITTSSALRVTEKKMLGCPWLRIMCSF